MKRIRGHNLLAVLLVAVCAAAVAIGLPRSSDNYQIETDSVTSGGTHESSSNYRNLGVLGEMVVGSAESTNYQTYGGILNNTGSSPEAPFDLRQFISDGETTIATGEWINEASVVLKFNMYDADGSDVLSPQVELKPTSEAFNGETSFTGADVDFSGSTVEGIVTVEGLAPGGTYHWRAKARDSYGLPGPWTAFGGNAETAYDFGVDITAPACSVFSPESGERLFGATTYEVRWIVTEEGGSGLIADPISLYYSTDGGSSWLEIATGEADDGLYAWSVPAVNSTGCFISIEAEDDAGNIGRNTTSAFEIFGSGWIEGVVTLEGAPDNSGVSVEVFENGSFSGAAVTAANGGYSIKVNAGYYHVEVAKSGYQMSIASVNVASSATVEGVNFYLAEAWPQLRQDRWKTSRSPHTDLYPPFAMAWSFNPGLPTFRDDVKVEDGRVIFATDYCTYALDEDGSFLWSYNAGGATFDIVEGVSIRDGKVYATHYVNIISPRLVCVSSETGALLWSTEQVGEEFATEPLLYAGRVFAATNAPGNLITWDLDGNFVWSFVSGSSVERNGVAGGGIVYWPFFDGNLYAFDSGTGSIVWSFLAGDRVAEPTLYGGRIYVGSVDNNLYALDAYDGSVQWSITATDWIFAGPAAVDGKLYIGDLDNMLYCVDTEGSIQWSYLTGGQIRETPMYANGFIYVVPSGGTTYGFNASDGSVKWSVNHGHWPYSSVSSHNGKLYAAAARTLFAYEDNTTPEAAASLEQFRSDGVTTIATGEWLDEGSVVLKFTMNDANDIDTLYPEVELRVTGESFTGAVTATGEGVPRSGSSVTGVVTIEGLSPGWYHWQARARDPQNRVGDWAAFGGNPETEADFAVKGPAWIKGTVTLDGQTDHSGALVEGYYRGRLYGSAETDSSGNYTLRVMNGTVSVEATRKGYELKGYSSGFDADIWTTTEGVDISLNRAWYKFSQDRWNSGDSPDIQIVPPLSLKWSFYANGKDIMSSPTVADGKVYFGSKDNKVYALDTSTGALEWSAAVNYWIFDSPAIYNGKLFVRCTQGPLWVFDPSNGDFIWSYQTGDGNSFSTFSGINPARGVLYFGSSNATSPLGRVFALDAESGQFLWSRKLADVNDNPCPIIDGDNLYTSSSGGVAINGTVYNLSPLSGSTRWNFYVNGALSYGMAFGNGRLFGADYNAKMFALDSSDGSFAWSFSTGSDENACNPAVAGGVMYAGSLDNRMYAFDDAQDGLLLWSFETGGDMRTVPVAANGALFFASNSDYHVYSLSTSEGNLLWSFNLGSWTYSAPAILDGQLFIGRAGGYFFAFENNSTPEAAEDLMQYRSDGATGIATGEWTEEDTVVFKFTMDDANGWDALYPEIELRLTDEAFTDNPTATGEAVLRNGASVEGVVTIEGIASGQYHWQSRARDPQGVSGAWIAFGGNPETGPDFSLDANVPEVTVLTPTSEIVYGGTTFEVAWLVTEEGGSGLIADPISLYYSTDGGSSWLEIATGEADDGLYVWYVPLANSNTCIISVEAEDGVGHVGRDISDVFQMSSKGWIKGAVTLNGESDHSGALVEAYVRGGTFTSEYSGSDGSYLIEVTTGNYSVEASFAGYVTDVYAGGINVPAGSTVEGIDLTLYKGWPQFHQDRHLTGSSPDRQMQLPLSVKWIYEWSALESAPSCADGKVFASGRNGSLMVLDESDGSVLWSYYPGSGNYAFTTPCYSEGKVYHGTAYRFFCFDADSGVFQWSYAYAAQSSRCSPAVYRGLVYFGASESGLPGASRYYALDADTGELVWSYPNPQLFGDSTPVIEGDNLYISIHGSGGGSGFRANLDPDTGEERWVYQNSGMTRYGFAYADGKLLGMSPHGSTMHGRIFAARTDSSGMHWSYLTDGLYEFYQVPAVSGETVYAGSSDHKFYALELSDGSLKWSFDAGEQIVCSPALENGMVFFTTQANEIYALSATDGTPLWSYSVSAAQWETFSPVVVHGTIYTVSYHDKLYAFYTNSTPEVTDGSLGQFRADTVTTIPTGEWTDEDTVVFKLEASDPDYSDTLYGQVELKLTDEAFDGTGLITGEGFSWLRDTTLEVLVTVEGISDSALGYHWRARVIDQYSVPSSWFTWGGNAEDENDFRLDATAPDITVLTPAAGVVYGGATFEVTWALTEEGGSGLIADPVSLYYSTNGGGSWTEIATGEADDGSYIWSVPAVNSSSCLVSVEAEDNLGNTGAGVSETFEIFSCGWIQGTVDLLLQSDDSGAVVEAYILGEAYGSAETSSDGTYSLKVLTGTYSVETRALGYETGIYAGPVEVSSGATVESIDLTVDRGWPQYHQDYHMTGNSPDKQVQFPLSLKWEVSIPQIESSPCVGNDKAFVVNNDGKIFSIDMADGSIAWSYYPGNLVSESTPCYYNGKVYYTASTRAFCVSEDGDFLWSYNQQLGSSASPAVYRGVMYYGAGVGGDSTRIFALEAESGRLLWSLKTDGSHVESTPVIEGDALYFTTRGESQYWGSILSADPGSGDLKWSYFKGGLDKKGVIYDDGSLYGIDGNYKIYSFDPGDTPGFNWSFRTEHWGNYYHVPSVSGEAVYVGSRDQNFYSLNRSDGSLRWSTPVGGELSCSPLIINGLIFFTSMDDKLYAASASDGSIHWSYTVDSAQFEAYSPAAAKGTVLVTSHYQKLLAFYSNSTPEVTDGSLGQYKSDAITAISTGEWTDEDTVVFKLEASDPDYSDTLYGQVELKLTDEAFDGTGLITGEGFSWLRGSTLEVLVTVEGIADSPLGYHWRARVIDQYSIPSSWFTWGGNPEDEDDFRVDANAPAITVLSPDSSDVLYGESTFEITWLLTEESGSGLIAGPMTLYYSTDEAASWYTIISQEADDGSYVWEVPKITSPTCLISIEAEDNVGNIGYCASGVFDIFSDGWISGTVTLSPEAAVSVEVSASQNGLFRESFVRTGSGPYVISGLLSGSYTVEVHAPGYELKSYPGGVNVQINSTAEGVDMTVASAWPAFKQDKWKSGNSPDSAVSPPFVLRWSYYTGDMFWFGSPQVRNGRIYATDYHKVIALDNEGDLKWSYDLGGNFMNDSSPCLYDGTVYVGSTDFNLYALDDNDGTLKWSFKTASLVRSAPLAADGTIYFCSQDGNLYALDPNGQMRWYFDMGASSSRSSPTKNRNAIYVSSASNKLFALTDGGELKWSFECVHDFHASPLYYDSTVYVGNYDNNLYALTEDGVVLWSYGTDSNIYSSASRGNGVVYVGSTSNRLFSVSTSGVFQWSFTSAGYITSSPTAANGFVFFGSYDNNIYAVDDNDGSFVWSFATGKDVISTPSILNGMLYISSSDSNLYAFEGDISPADPYALNQYRSDGLTIISTGEWVNSSSLVLKADVSDPNYRDTLYLEAEVRPTSESFDGTITATGEGFDSTGGSPVTASVTVEGLSSGSLYHWRVRARDSGGLLSGWVSFGGNAEEAGDFGVDTTAPAISVLSPTAEVINGGGTFEVRWVLTEEGGSGLTADPVSLYYSTDGGESWIEIATEESDDGSYVWDVPSSNSGACFVSIEAEDNAGNRGRGLSAAFEILSDGWIKGEVTLAGEPVHAGALVEAYILGGMYATDESASDGTYTLRVAAGTYSVEAGRRGFEVDGYSGPVSVTAGSTVEGIDMTLGKAWPQFHQDPHLTGNSYEQKLDPPLSFRWVYDAGSNIETPPIVAENKVFFTTSSNIMAVHATEGNLLWSHRFEPAPYTGHIAHALCYYKGIVCGCRYGRGGRPYKDIYAVDASDGSFRWSYAIQDSATSVGLIPVARRGLIYAGGYGNYADDNKYYFGIKADSGDFVWSYKAPNGVYRINAAGTIVGNDLYVPLLGSAWIAGGLADIDPSTGQFKWSLDLAHIARKGFSYRDGRLFSTTMGSDIIAVDTSTRNFAWSYNMETDFHYDGYQIPAVSGESVYIGGDDGIFFNLSASDGSLQWSTDVGSSLVNSPAVAMGHVYSPSEDGIMHAFRASDGAVVWSYDLGASGAAYEIRSPVVCDGYLYVNPLSSKMFAFENNATPEAPEALMQYQADGATEIPTGEWTSDRALVTVTVSDPNNVETLYPEVEYKLLAQSFTGVPDATGEAVYYSGSPEAGLITLEGLTNLSQYHWRVRARDIAGYSGDWVSFGGNLESEIDFQSDTVTPEVPSTLNAIAQPSTQPAYVALSWGAATDEYPGSGFEGYYWLRSPTSSEGYERRITDPQTETATNDVNVAFGNEYYYVVASKDNAGNVSEYSNESSPPNIIVSKTMTVESPTGGGYGGGSEDAVPGSTIIFTINYTNNGFAPAANLQIVDKIPSYTDYEIGTATGEALLSVEYSDDDGSSYGYSPTGEAVDESVTNIRWNCVDLDIDESSGVTYRVIIK